MHLYNAIGNIDILMMLILQNQEQCLCLYFLVSSISWSSVCSCIYPSVFLYGRLRGVQLYHTTLYLWDTVLTGSRARMVTSKPQWSSLCLTHWCGGRCMWPSWFLFLFCFVGAGDLDSYSHTYTASTITTESPHWLINYSYAKTLCPDGLGIRKAPGSFANPLDPKPPPFLCFVMLLC